MSGLHKNTKPVRFKLSSRSVTRYRCDDLCILAGAAIAIHLGGSDLVDHLRPWSPRQNGILTVEVVGAADGRVGLFKAIRQKNLPGASR